MPYRIEGQKTASFEICDVLRDAPHFQVMPVGNAGNITAYWKGYKEYYSLRKISRLPVMCGFQAKGSAPIVLGRPINNPKTIATAIRIGNPASWKKAEEARDQSRGLIASVTDSQIVSAYKLLSDKEGVFVEPASAASVAGLMKLKQMNFFSKRLKSLAISSKDIKIVCVLTGHGLKDPNIAIKNIREPKAQPADIKKVVKVLGLKA